MNEDGKSESCVVSAKLSNKDKMAQVAMASAETMEKRQLAKGNWRKQTTNRTQGREIVQRALSRIRNAAVNDKQQKFTALMHHIYRVEQLREAYFSLKRSATAGIDGVTWHHYGEQLEANLQQLSQRLKRGAYQAKPVTGSQISLMIDQSCPV